MRTRAISSSGERIPVVGLGTARQFDAAPSAYGSLREVLRRFVDLGGRVVDTSPMYGRAEKVLGELSGELGVVDELFWATKVWTHGREAGVEQMRQSGSLLGTEVIDLMQVHNLTDTGTHLRTLRSWKEDGKVRYLGVTHYRAEAFDELARWIRTGDLDWVQLPYNLDMREAESGLLPLAQEHGTAVVVNVPFGNGRLFRKAKGHDLPGWAGEQVGAASWAQFFLKYILGHPAVTCVIPATSDPEHLVDNMGAGTGKLPDADTRRRMAAFWDELG